MAYKSSPSPPSAPDHALLEAGCDDALVGSSGGIQYFDFDREAESLEEAALSAVADIESVVGLKVVRLADAGLVSMADIAEHTGRTRGSVRLLVAGERGPGGFPPPATDPPRPLSTLVGDRGGALDADRCPL